MQTVTSNQVDLATLSSFQRKLRGLNRIRPVHLMSMISPITLAACGGNVINQLNGNGQINIGNTNNGTVETNIGNDNVGSDVNSGTAGDGNTSDTSSQSGSEEARIFGTLGNDLNLRGTSGDDVIDPLSGNDQVFTLSGADTVYLGSGRKYIDFGVDNSPDELIVDLDSIDATNTLVNFSYSNEDKIQFEGVLYDGFDKTALVTREELDDFVGNVKFQQYIASLAENNMHAYLFNTEIGSFGSNAAINFREENDVTILQVIENALEDNSSGQDGLGLLSGSTEQVQNAIDGAKLILSFADTFGNVAWVVYDETGGDLDFADELSLILVTSMTPETSFSGDMTLPGGGDIG